MKNRTFLITGITGTLGSVLVRKLLETCPDCNVIGISRDEQKQQAFALRDERLTLRLADIRDYHSLRRAAGGKRIDIIFHLAALKCQPLLESNPHEALLTNVKGIENVVNLAKATGAKVCFTSSDKAVYPINFYGMTKGIGERLVLNADPSFVVCRYGNVLGSRGSFLPLLVKSLQTEGKAYLTHKDMTRFWLPMHQVAEFVLASGFHRSGLCTPPEMKASYVTDLIAAVANILGISDYETIETGTRPGEKVHEIISTAYETGESDVTSGDHKNHMAFGDLEGLVRGIVNEIASGTV